MIPSGIQGGKVKGSDVSTASSKNQVMLKSGLNLLATMCVPLTNTHTFYQGLSVG